MSRLSRSRISLPVLKNGTLFWSTGWQFLGANVAGAVVQPFYYTAAFPTEGGEQGALAAITAMHLDSALLANSHS